MVWNPQPTIPDGMVRCDDILMSPREYVQYRHDHGYPPDPDYAALTPDPNPEFPKLYFDDAPPETRQERRLRRQQSLPPPATSQPVEDTVVSHANLSVVPPLIMDELVDTGDVNMLLGCFSDSDETYNPLQKFQMVAAALFPLWLEMEPFFLDFPKDAEDGRKVLVALCDFIKPFTPPSPTRISPAPLPVEIPPTPALDVDTTMVVDGPSDHERTPTPRPTQKGKMKAVATPPPAPLPVPSFPAAPRAQAPTQKPRAPRPKPSAPPAAAAPAAAPAPPPASYAKAAASAPKPKYHARPSLVVHIRKTVSSATLREFANTKAPILVAACNEALGSEARYANVRVSAAKWSPAGNLVVFSGPETTSAQLTAAHHIIVSAIEGALPGPISLSSRPNVKWSKLLINAVPTGVTGDTPAHSREACHQALLRDNPSYRRLRVTQLPSWVRKPDGYLANSSSSLVVAFEDPDGSTLSSLLTQRYLFAFGAQLPVHKWRQPPHIKAHSEAARQKRVKTRLVREAHARYASAPQIPVSASPLPEGLDPSHLGGVPPPPAPAPSAPAAPPLTALSKGQRKKAIKRRRLEEGNVSA